MSDSFSLNRRRFVQLGAYATTAAAFSGNLFAAESTADAIGSPLPDLPYAYDALEPHIDAATMRLHHDKHHAAYLTKLKEALPKLQGAGPTLHAVLADLPSISDEALRTTVRNNGGGDWNHRFFWTSLTPADQSGKPGDKLAAAIDKDFGSFEKFKTAFNEAATKRFGSGWAWLIVQDGKLKVTSTANQDNPLMKGMVDAKDLGTPILGLDVWEHAYYLHYQNKRPDYINAWWNIVNWSEAEKRFTAAS